MTVGTFWWKGKTPFGGTIMNTEGDVYFQTLQTDLNLQSNLRPYPQDLSYHAGYSGG